MKKIEKYFILALAFFVLPLIASAQCVIPDAKSAETLCNTIVDVGDIIVVVGFAIAVIFIIVAGIKYVTAGENEDQTKSARKMITNALIGVAILLLAYFLVEMVANFIQTKFGV